MSGSGANTTCDLQLQTPFHISLPRLLSRFECDCTAIVVALLRVLTRENSTLAMSILAIRN